MHHARKRRKTFTGCWTCRERKVKCDEARPHCRNCKRKSLACEGYGVRLQWLAPVVACDASENVDKVDANPLPSGPLRRPLPSESHHATLPSEEVDRILKHIDSFRNDSSNSNRNLHVRIANFSVLDLCLDGNGASRISSQEEVLTPFQPHSNANSRNESPTSPSNNDSMLIPNQHRDGALRAASTSVPYSTPVSVVNTHQAASPWIGDLQAIDSANVTQYVSGCTESMLVNDIGRCVQTPSVVDEDWLHHDIVSLDSPEPFSSPNLDRFLMRHYANRVCHLFCAIDTPKSPWRTIHLPRALQGMGEISVSGKTSRVRRALLNALLSVSAWYLSNDHQRHQHGDLAQQWAQVATKHGCSAIALLGQAVENDLYQSPRPRYKEFLATMLSMVTINVMSGDTSTCSVHLDGAGQLIQSMWRKKQKFSEKAKALHRIYCYLRIIWESTNVRRRSNFASASLQSSDVVTHAVFSSDNFFDKDDEHEPTTRSVSQMPSLKETAGIATFECIYGIPQSLLAMLEEIVNMIDRVDQARQVCNSNYLPETLSASCDELEQSILEWQVADNPEAHSQSSVDISEELILHQTRSFHSALIIFFSQNVRLLDHRFLQHYVEDILQSIETIERIKASTNVLAAPLFWPAFIAATEAFDLKQQARFRKWYEGVESYGIAAIRTGIRVIHEVWKNGPSRGKQGTSQWRQIVTHTGDSLMLS